MMGTALDRLREAWHNAGLAFDDKSDNTASAQAPGHTPADRSVSIRQIDGQVLMHCHAGEITSDVLAEVGLSITDLFDSPSGVTYMYPDGRQVHRTPSKRFRQAGNTAGNALYRAEKRPEGKDLQVYVVEGEKDVHALESVGAPAVTSGGANTARKRDWSPLQGRHVTIVADDDQPGHKFATQVAAELENIAASITTVAAKTGKDAADHIAAGHSLAEFQRIETNTRTRPRLWRATELRPSEQMRWIAKHRLPMSAVSLLVGDEGIGKSLWWIGPVTAITTGQAAAHLGIPERDPADVVLVITEDVWSATVRPRLEVAGANLDRITVICEEEDGTGTPVFPRDMDLIDQAIETVRPALIVVDAWLDTVPSALNVKDPQHARQALHPWRDAATRGDCAVLLLTHTNRIATSNARDKYGATAELRKKARMTLFAQLDDDGNLSVGPEKSNLVSGVPASLFRIEPVQYFEPNEEDDGTIPRLVYLRDDTRTASETILENFVGDDGDDRDSIDTWLCEFLNAGPVKATEVYSAADANGYSKDQAKRAKKRLNIMAEKSGGDGPWIWKLAKRGTEDEHQMSTKGAPRGQTVPISHQAAPLLPSMSEGVRETPAQTKGAREQSQVMPPAAPFHDARREVLGALSSTYGMDARVLAQSVSPRYRDQVNDILEAFVAEGIATTDGTKYLLASVNESAA